MLSPDDVATITGEKKPDRRAPESRAEDATNKLSDLDQRMSEHVERERRPDESHQQAHARLLAETPGLYEGLKRGRARILSGAGVKNAAVGGV